MGSLKHRDLTGREVPSQVGRRRLGAAGELHVARIPGALLPGCAVTLTLGSAQGVPVWM